MSNEPLPFEMRLSDAELTLVRRLRQKEEGWHRMRWAIVIVGSVVLTGSLLMFERIWNTVAPDQILIMVCIVVAPISGVALFAGLAGIAYVLVYWSGCPARKLLLRLSDEI